MQVNKELNVEPNKIKYDRLTEDEKELITENDIVSINQLSKIDDIELIDVMNRKNTPPYDYIKLCSIDVSDDSDPIYYDIDKIDGSHTLKIPDYVSNEIRDKIINAINRPVSVQEMEVY